MATSNNMPEPFYDVITNGQSVGRSVIGEIIEAESARRLAEYEKHIHQFLNTELGGLTKEEVIDIVKKERPENFI